MSLDCARCPAGCGARGPCTHRRVLGRPGVQTSCGGAHLRHSRRRPTRPDGPGHPRSLAMPRPRRVVETVWRSGARRARGPRGRVQPDDCAGGRPVPTGARAGEGGPVAVLPDGHRRPIDHRTACVGEPVGSARTLRVADAVLTSRGRLGTKPTCGDGSARRSQCDAPMRRRARRISKGSG